METLTFSVRLYGNKAQKYWSKWLLYASEKAEHSSSFLSFSFHFIYRHNYDWWWWWMMRQLLLASSHMDLAYDFLPLTWSGFMDITVPASYVDWMDFLWRVSLPWPVGLCQPSTIPPPSPPLTWITVSNIIVCLFSFWYTIIDLPRWHECSGLFGLCVRFVSVKP